MLREADFGDLPESVSLLQARRAFRASNKMMLRAFVKDDVFAMNAYFASEVMFFDLEYFFVSKSKLTKEIRRWCIVNDAYKHFDEVYEHIYTMLQVRWALNKMG